MLTTAQMLAIRRLSRGGGWPQTYIDPAQAGTGHAGSYSDPYSTADAITYDM